MTRSKKPSATKSTQSKTTPKARPASAQAKIVKAVAAKKPQTKPTPKNDGVTAKVVGVPKAVTAVTPPKKSTLALEDMKFAREYWTGDSRDGVVVNGDGYHYYRMTKAGKILEAYEFYETEEGRECACPLPEMLNVHWIEDLGFEDFEALDNIKEYDFERIKEISSGVTSD